MSRVIDRVNPTLSYGMNKIVGILAAIQAIQVSNVIPSLIDPRPEFALGLLPNSAAGVAAFPVAYAVWSRKKHGLLIAALFSAFSLASAAYFQHLTVAHSREASFPPPLTVSIVVMAVNVILVSLLASFQTQRRNSTDHSRHKNQR